MNSLRKNFQFRTVYNRGTSYANHLLVMYVYKNNLNINRIGISVSKKVGISVVRSRVTRLIRESYRLSEHMYETSYDIVIIARVSAASSTYNDICKSMKSLAKRHNVLRI